MKSSGRSCSICSAEADWVRVRMPHAKQMDCLCQRHYQSLLERNPIMAAWYDNIAAVPPMATEPGLDTEESRKRS